MIRDDEVEFRSRLWAAFLCAQVPGWQSLSARQEASNAELEASVLRSAIDLI